MTPADLGFLDLATTETERVDCLEEDFTSLLLRGLKDEPSGFIRAHALGA